MNAAKKNRVSFEDMPDMMAELLDEVRSLGNRVKKLENTCSCRRSDISMREILTAMEVAKMLKEKRSYTTITKETGASAATISRVSRCLEYGTGGYKTVIERLNEEKSNG